MIHFPSFPCRACAFCFRVRTEPSHGPVTKMTITYSCCGSQLQERCIFYGFFITFIVTEIPRLSPLARPPSKANCMGTSLITPPIRCSMCSLRPALSVARLSSPLPATTVRRTVFCWLCLPQQRCIQCDRSCGGRRALRMPCLQQMPVRPKHVPGTIQP